MNKNILIVKADGSEQIFEAEKLRQSLRNVRTSPALIDKIVRHIENELREGMTTSHIYQHAFSVLHRLSYPTALRYSLRRALAALGPTGFPFEKYVAEVLKNKGFQTSVGLIYKGKCVEHEIDVTAWDDRRFIMAEVKFHHDLGYKSDLKVALYVKARFDDLREKTFNIDGKERMLDEGWLVTNTKFTQNAINYAKCAGVKLIGWNYPEKGNLQEMIEDGNLHPITVLRTPSKSDLQRLFEGGVVLCNQAVNKKLVSAVGFHNNQVSAISSEAMNICP